MNTLNVHFLSNLKFNVGTKPATSKVENHFDIC